MIERASPTKSADAYRTIGEVAEELKLPQHVLRFWETRFPQVKPLKRAGGRRFYRPEDVALLRAIRELLYGQGYTIKGVQRMLQDHGPRGLVGGGAAIPAAVPPSPGRDRPPEARQGATTVMRDEPPFFDQEATSPAERSAAPMVSRPAATDPVSMPRLDIVDRLEAIALDLGECERLLAAARSTQN